jgi:hypothetical protein
MLNFRNSGQGAGVGSMYVKQINPTYLWSFIGVPTLNPLPSGSGLVANDSISSVPLNYNNGASGGTISNINTNSLQINQGTSSKVLVTASFGSLNSFTFSFWANTAIVSSTQRILELFSSSGNTFQIDVVANNNYPQVSSTIGNINTTQVSLLTNTIAGAVPLQHICVTVNGTTLKLYINGISVYSGTFPAAGMNSFFIANKDNPNGTLNCNCTIADIKIYNFVMSQTQITALFNANQAVNAVIPTVNFINLY